MKQVLMTAVGALLCVGAAQAEVGVSINIGEPGFYGRIDLGDYPRPRLIYADPLVIETVRVVREPLYLRVPPGHAKDWRKHCHKYDACGRPTYFVQDDWYESVYVPSYQSKHGKNKAAKGKHKDNGHDHDHDHDGKGNGKGKGKDKD